MKTHEHALISLGYGAILAAAAGHSLLDPALYASALIGGELIDVIDHPLYHLVLARNDRVVKEARTRWKNEGFRSAVRYLFQKEDERAYNKMRLHNVLSLTFFALAAIFTSLYLPGSVYAFVMLGAFLLHMLTDIYGDFQLLGHFDNWLWILPEKALAWIERLGQRIIRLVLLWWLVVLVGFFVVSLRAGWQLFRPSTYYGLAAEALNRTPPAGSGSAAAAASGDLWLAYGPLLFLLIYFSLIFLLMVASAHKIHLETPADRRGHRSRFTTGSLQVIWDGLRGRLPKDRRNFEKILLAMQSDQAVWILIVTVLIAALLMIENLLRADIAVILYTPVICALVFGTLVHTTIGEFGGVQGVLLATFLNLITTSSSSPYRWPYYFGYFLFLAAGGAWILGLLGGIILRENKRLSLISYVMKFRYEASPENEAWRHQVLDMIHHGVETGYARARLSLYGEGKKKVEAVQSQVDFLLAPQTGAPILSGDYFHLAINDSIVPMFQEFTYVLCDNRLTSHGRPGGKFGLLPLMPRTRVVVSDGRDADLIWRQGNYFWDSTAHPLCLPSCENAAAWLPPGANLGLVKTWGELSDNLLTRKSTFRSDLYLFPAPDEPCSMILCGLCRTTTSTKEYATLEAEVYASEVRESITEISHRIPGLRVVEDQSARIIYPGFSFDDQKTVEAVRQAAVFPTPVPNCYSKDSAALLTKALGLIPGKTKSTNAMSDFNRRILVLAGQLGLSFPVTFAFLWEVLRISNALEWLLKYLLSL